MQKTEILIEKIESNFKSLQTVGEQSLVIESLVKLKNERIDLENKAMQATIDANLKLKEGK